MKIKKKRGAPFKRPEELKKQIATRIDPGIRAWLRTQKNQAKTVENALLIYKAFLKKKHAKGDNNMKYKFDSKEEALRFGDQATPAECEKLKKAIIVFETQYKILKKRPTALRNFERRLNLSKWSHFCRVALEQAAFALASE